MKKNQIIKYSITILFLLFPFLDMLRTTPVKDIEILGISCIEFINILLISTALITTIIKIFKNKKKDILLLLIYLILSGIYMYYHYQNMMLFDTNLLISTDFNLTRECFYIFRVYILPIFLLFILLENKDIFNKDFYYKIAKIVIITICSNILITDIFKISYQSYSATTDLVQCNFIDYFICGTDYKAYAARGWFDSANEISAILLMLFPVNIYMLYKDNTKINYVLYLMQLLTMIILGTRTGAVGSILIAICSIICFFICDKLRKRKYNFKFINTFLILTGIGIIYLAVSPFMLAYMRDMNYDFSIQNQEAYDKLMEAEPTTLREIMDKYSSEYLINPIFYEEYYPIEIDPEYWQYLALRDKSLNSDNRKFKMELMQRIIKRNNNKNDALLGIGYTSNFMDFERDYYFQYYIFGILGIILFVAPYILLFFYNLVLLIKHFKKNIRFITVISFMSPALGLVIAYYSGHVFGWVSPMMYLVMFEGLLTLVVYNNITNKKIKNK